MVQDIEEKFKSADIRKEVQIRVAQEAARLEKHGWTKKSSDIPEITPAFIFECLYKNELGDGMLFAAHYSGKFIFNVSEGSWYEWQDHHWERDTTGRVLGAVDTVAESYLFQARRLTLQIQEIIRGETKECSDDLS